MKWAAIDFETANPSSMSACAVGLTVFDEGEMVFSGSWLIRKRKPPELPVSKRNVI